MSQKQLLEANGLSRHYGHYLAVADMNINLQQGEVLGLLGPNGAGKSTTMQMLTGNLAPSAGSISINGIDLLEQPKAAKRHLGYLPEQPPVYRDLSVDEYLRYSGRLHGLSRKELPEALERAKRRCGLEHVSKRLIGNLSKGYQQRVGIAQAIIHQPLVIILDEPTVGLDPIQIREIRQLIRELGNDHSVILSTHILPEVQAVCDRVQIIHQGQTAFADTLEGLEQRHAKAVLNLHFTQAPDKTTLEAIDNVTRVETLANGAFRLEFSGELTAMGQNLAQMAVENHWGLYEISPEKVTLEHIFLDLVYRETEQEAPQEEQAA